MTATSDLRNPPPGSPSTTWRGQTPHGVQDCFLVEAARRCQAENALRECFFRWGYRQVIPPTFEYYESLVVGASAEHQQAVYRFFDQEHTLALRVDFTPQVARMAATKLFDQPMPLRCFYVGSVFRREDPQAGRRREFTQAGVEFIGVDTPAADAQAIALANAALETLDLHRFQINLGQPALFRALTQDLPAGALVPVQEAVDCRNRARLGNALDQAGVTGNRRDLLVRLPDLIGESEVLEEARARSANLPQAVRAVERLAQVYHLLQAYGVSDRVVLDLGEVRGMDYYTGVTFRGVAPGLGWPIVSGGRYDDLVARFGRPLAAIGFGLCIERALLAQARQGTPPPSLAPHVLVQGCHHPACLTLVKHLRERGCCVEVDVLGLDEGDLTELARRRGVARTLRCADDAWLLTDGTGTRALTEAALLQETRTWLEKSKP